MDWKLLRTLHHQENPLQGSRAPEVEEAYRAFREGPRAETDAIREQLRTTPFLLKLNLFPYDLPECPDGRPLAHVLLWCARDCDFAEADDQWRKLIKEHHNVVEGVEVDPSSYVLTRNIRANQTVPDITHYHVFTAAERQRPRASRQAAS